MLTFTENYKEILSPKMVTILLLIAGLCGIVFFVLSQNWVALVSVCTTPLFILLFVYSTKYPIISFTLYAATAYFFGALDRYTDIEGISIVLDVTLFYTLITLILNYISHTNSKIHFRNIANTLTISYLFWMVFIILQLINQGTDLQKITTGSRSWFLGIPILYILASLLLDSPKRLRNALITLGIFTIIAFGKLLWQKYRWFDTAETAWLLEGSWHTHLLSTGIRYFSLFSDAGNFGAIMGMTTTVYSILFTKTSSRKLRNFYLVIAIMGFLGMLMSGTRGSVMIPLGGLLLYCLICRNIKATIVTAVSGITIFCFFSFTDIGESNAMIRRMRTAFRPTEDASFNVRLENQEKIARYLEEHPMGAGIGGSILTTIWEGDKYQDYTIPPDSFYVDIWTQTGSLGLGLYILILSCITLRCCYIIMFRIHNPELRNTFAALLCGVFGLFLNGYVGRGMGFQPGVSIIGIFLAFILNGPYIEQQITKNK